MAIISPSEPLLEAATAHKNMVLWGFRWLKLYLNPYANNEFEHISTESERREYILGRLEAAEFSEWSWVVIVAGVGFFTDAYSIFAINMVMPMIDIIYYDGKMPHNYEIAVGVVTLGGSIIGQVGFGFAADVWGRRKMYGQELIITIGATLGVLMASTGAHGSMSIIVWLLVWRFVLGIGIGADYPLSAVICSEFAPTHLRGKMLTLVFACQPLGQLAASLVSLAAVSQQRGGIPSDSTVHTDLAAQICNDECKRTLDSVWRWIIGVGVIPAVIALWFRLTIIESPRYTADVGQDSRKAASELNQYLLMQTQHMVATSISVHEIPNAENLVQRRRSSGAISGANSEESGQASRSPSPPAAIDRAGPFVQEELLGGYRPDSLLPPSRLSDVEPFQNHLSNTQHGTDIGLSPMEGHDPFNRKLEDAAENDVPPPPSWKDFKKYFWHDGNLRTLIATSFCWFCLDLPFYGLGMNSPHIISIIWYGKTPPPTQIYTLLIHDIWQSLIVVSVGALVGCAITFVAIDKLGRRNIQMIGFFWLFILFIIIGGSFYHLYEIGGSAAIIVLYILCQIFFNFGPNTTTYIIPAELFPTRYRGLCHGISAAFGKLGSVIAQLFLAYINYGHGINYQHIQRWLPYSLLIFSIFMLLGLLTTYRWLPGDEHSPSGSVKTLEQWEVGRLTPNGFAHTKRARAFAAVWKWYARASLATYLFLDGVVGGDARERREVMRLEREEEEDRERERELGDLGGGGLGGGSRNSHVSDVVHGSTHGVEERDRMMDYELGSAEMEEQRRGGQERGPSPFVSGSAHRGNVV